MYENVLEQQRILRGIGKVQNEQQKSTASSESESKGFWGCANYGLSLALPPSQKYFTIENLELEKTISKSGFTKDVYLFLTIKTIYLYHMKSGEKSVDFILSRLYKDFRKNKFLEPEKLSHVLFHTGYNPDSPRLLIELRGWNNQGENHPKNLNISGHEI